jgi:predicted ribosome quality control (RQC) complex YloA/Tae2 family protein
VGACDVGAGSAAQALCEAESVEIQTLVTVVPTGDYLLGMAIRWDSLLARHAARELDEALAGARLRALRLDGALRDVALLFRKRTLLWRLHPERGWLRLTEPLDPDPSDIRLRGRVRRVSSPPDERIVRIELEPERGGRGPIQIVIELVGNQWNALVLEGPEEVIRHVLVRRDKPRPQRVGTPYEPPTPTDRLGATEPVAWEAWWEALAAVAPAERARVLVRSFAWTGPLVAPTILGRAAGEGGDAALRAAYDRWQELASGSVVAPMLLQGDEAQPYPVGLTDVSSRPTPSLLAAFDAYAERAEAAGDAPPALAVPPELLARLDEAVRHSERRASRLRREFDGLEDTAPLRALGDLILARYRKVPKGAERAELTGFTGEPVTVDLDPALEPHANADRYYDRAARIERARDGLPGLIAKAERALERLERLRVRAEAGEVERDELDAALPARASTGQKRAQATMLPYRTFRSSGGLEIRVGRGARHNDDLTFRHSAPHDVWLHARHTAGAHVVLRWQGSDTPPARDLAEAATLAALHSKARTSGSVPVDWTLRKHVRKPRGAAPGSVVPDRVRTVFVEPDERLLEALAVEE